jgi:hypothetical protein
MPADVETLQGVRKGERVLQIGVGSGVKCGVAVWRALRDVHEPHAAWEVRPPSHQPALPCGARLCCAAPCARS